MFQLPPLTPDFQQAVDNGRVLHLALGLGKGKLLSTFVIYGWTGGAQNKKAARKSAALFEAIIGEIAAHPLGPMLIMGNLNSDPKHIAPLEELLARQSWTDIGAIADTWGRVPFEPTCLTAVSNRPSRRDYMFCNSQLLPLVSDFEVMFRASIPTHATIRLTLKVFDVPILLRVAKQLPNMWLITQEHYEQLNENLAELPEHEKQLLWKQYLCGLHAKMDTVFCDHHERLHQLLAARELDEFWHQWSSLFEDAINTAHRHARA